MERIPYRARRQAGKQESKPGQCQEVIEADEVGQQDVNSNPPSGEPNMAYGG